MDSNIGIKIEAPTALPTTNLDVEIAVAMCDAIKANAEALQANAEALGRIAANLGRVTSQVSVSGCTVRQGEP